MNNNDLISRAWVLAEYDRQHKGPPGGARKIMEEAPAVDAVPVVHARWKAYSVPHWTKRYDDNGDPEYKYHDEYVCSICRRRTIIKENYCPNCGAKMDEGMDGEG